MLAADVVTRLGQRFLGHVRISPSGCWEWTGRTKDGYGQYSSGGRDLRAHRYAYERVRGAIPEGLQLDHLCRNRRCASPDHLEPVTPTENRFRAEERRYPRREQPLVIEIGERAYKALMEENLGIFRGMRVSRDPEEAIRTRALWRVEARTFCRPPGGKTYGYVRVPTSLNEEEMKRLARARKMSEVMKRAWERRRAEGRATHWRKKAGA